MRSLDSPDHNERILDAEPADDTAPSVARSAATMSAMTLISRVTGFMRTWALAFALGNTFLASSYDTANNIPNMIYELIMGGVLSTAFLPVYLEVLAQHGRDRAWRYASNLINITLVVLGSIAVLATVFAPQFIWTQMFTVEAQHRELATYLFRFFTIQIVVYGIGGVVSGILNAERRFLWPAAAPIFNNIVVIATLLIYPLIARNDPDAALVWLAIGTTLGVVAMLIVQIPSLKLAGMRYFARVDFTDPGLKTTAALIGPAVLFTITNLVVVTFRNAFAYDVADNGVSTLRYAWMWFQFPYGVLAVALSTAFFTELSRAAGARDMESFKRHFTRGLRSTFVLIIPMAVMLFVLAEPLITLFKAGEFTADDIGVVARVLTAWAVSLPVFAAYMYTYFAFSALKDLKTVVNVKVVVTVAQVALLWILMTGAGGWDGIGLLGVPVTDLVVYTSMFLILVWLLRRRIGRYDLSSVVTVFVNSTIASLVGGAVAWGILRLLPGSDPSLVRSFLVLMVCGLPGLTVAWGVAALLRVPEVAVLGSLIGRVKGMVTRR